MKIRFIIITGILFLSIYSCGSHKKKAEDKYTLDEKKDKKKKKKEHKPTIAEIFAEKIKGTNLEFHVKNLSDSIMQGRETGTKGERKAADYIKGFFEDEELLFPDQLKGYFQKYTATQNKKPEASLLIEEASFHFGEDFIGFFPHDSIEMNFDDIIYVQHGIDEKKYNDYAFKDVKGKVVLVVGGEPKDKYGNYIISNEVDPYTGRSLPSVWSQDPIKAYILRRNAAMKNGAKMMLYYDPQNIDYFWENYKHHFENSQAEVSLSQDSIYDFFINKAVFSEITGYENPAEIEYNKETRKMSVPITLRYESRGNVIHGINVMGIIEGDSLATDYVIILSHYDGQGRQNSQLYPSANDNASGVAASFEIAKALYLAQDSGYVAKKHIVFLNVSGTEQNKIGSRYYVTHPVIPLEQTAAVIELHQLGRVRENNMGDITDLFPLNISFDGFNKKEFKKEIEKLQSYNDHISIKYKPLVDHSDYIYFMRKHLPVIYLNGGYFKDYHKPTDTYDRISYEVLEKRTKFIFQIIWDLVYQED